MLLSRVRREADGAAGGVPVRPWTRRAQHWAAAAIRKAWEAPLEWRFLLFSVVVLVTGAVVIGSWTAGEIRNRVMHQAAATNALYVESFVSPLLQPLQSSSELPPENIALLRGLISDSALGEKIVSFKVWSPSGTIIYAIDDRLIGQRFERNEGFERALEGDVATGLSSLAEEENRFERTRWSELLETYSPVHSGETGRVIAVSEFYQLPHEILGEVRSSQLQGWVIVGVATLLMFLILNGMVRQASATIRTQNLGLRRLHERLRTASASRIETEERVLSRVAQELHDAPAQGLALALLRLEALETASPTARSKDWQLVRETIDQALADLRDTSGAMRIPDLDGLDGESVVTRAVADFSRRTERAVSFRWNGGSVGLSAPAKVAAYRIVQEALNNSFLHAQCAGQSVSAVRQAGWLELEIADDGVGWNPAAAPMTPSERPRLGLRGMRDRAEMLGGSLDVISRPGEGTRIVARLPGSSEEYRD